MRHQWTTEEMAGTRFGQLTVTKVLGKRGTNRLVKCKCDCGKSTQVLNCSLTSGMTQSCGHLHTKHRQSAAPEYSIWCNARARAKRLKWTFFPAWKDYTAFMRSMGPRPTPEHFFRRIDKTCGYSPDNCEWALNKA